jgi:phage tail sheath protein FI
LLTPLDTEVDLTQGERDLMYGFGNAVNPIVNFPQDGITVWGQRTLQRKQSALDRVNVRMLLIYIKKNATVFLRNFVFEPNDKITRAQVVNVSTSFLADIAARRGLQAYNVVCDERNNTAERIDRNELHVAYFLKPTRAAEFIVLSLVVLRTDASFSAAEILAAGGVVSA